MLENSVTCSYFVVLAGMSSVVVQTAFMLEMPDTAAEGNVPGDGGANIPISGQETFFLDKRSVNSEFFRFLVKRQHNGCLITKPT